MSAGDLANDENSNPNIMGPSLRSSPSLGNAGARTSPQSRLTSSSSNTSRKGVARSHAVSGGKRIILRQTNPSLPLPENSKLNYARAAKKFPQYQVPWNPNYAGGVEVTDNIESNSNSSASKNSWKRRNDDASSKSRARWQIKSTVIVKS